LTSPIFYNGSVFLLEDAVRHELEQGDDPFTDEDVSLITLFVNGALKDDSKKPNRPRTVPSGLTPIVDLGT